MNCGIPMAELLLSRLPIGGYNCGRPIMRTPVWFLWVVNLRFSLCEIYVQNQWGHDYRSDRMLICVLILICETSCEKPIFFFFCALIVHGWGVVRWYSQVRFLIVWLSLNSFRIYQPAVTDSMHLQSTYTPHLKHIQSEAHLEYSWTSGVEVFFVKIAC